MGRNDLRRCRAAAVALLGIAALTAGAGAADAGASYRAQSASRFTVEIPSHWTVTRHDDGGAEVTLKAEEAAAGGPVAACLFRAVDAAGLFAGRSAIEIEKTRDYAISPAGMRLGLPADERGLEWGETAISGEPAGLVVTQAADAEVRRLSIMAMTEKASYFVVCSTHAAAFAQRRATFERIIGSFVIVE